MRDLPPVHVGDTFVSKSGRFTVESFWMDETGDVRVRISPTDGRGGIERRKTVTADDLRNGLSKGFVRPVQD